MVLRFRNLGIMVWASDMSVHNESPADAGSNRHGEGRGEGQGARGESQALRGGGRILVIEDDEPLARFVPRTLETNAFHVELAHDGEAALEAIQASTYQLLILDLNLPRLDGVSLLRRLRPSHPRLPVLVLTARSRVEDMVTALESGADDCLVKPFSFVELLARVRALLRRNSGVVPNTSQVADLTLNRTEYRVERNGRRIDLTPREFGILEYLMRSVGTPVSRATLMREVWNTELDSTTNIVDVYVKYVRDKVDLPGEAKLLRTIRGVGYVLTDE